MNLHHEITALTNALPYAESCKLVENYGLMSLYSQPFADRELFTIGVDQEIACGLLDTDIKLVLGFISATEAVFLKSSDEVFIPAAVDLERLITKSPSSLLRLTEYVNSLKALTTYQLRGESNSRAEMRASYLVKDVLKFASCSHLITRGVVGSSSHRYATSYSPTHSINADNYPFGAVVGISSNGGSSVRSGFDRHLVTTAAQQSCSFVVDNSFHRGRKYNTGEREVFDYLVDELQYMVSEDTIFRCTLIPSIY